VALAEATPAGKFGWRPAAGVRSTSEVYMHIALANFFLLSVTGPKMPAELNSPDLEKTVTAKADVIDWLKRSLEAVKTAHAALKPADLRRAVKVDNRDATVEGMYLRIIVHANEHMGQLIAYARMTGVRGGKRKVRGWSRIVSVKTPRRDFLRCAAMAGSVAFGQVHSKAATTKPGMPGPFPGRVIAVTHPGCIAGGAYQSDPIRKMMEKGMTSLTGAPAWTDAWRSFFEKGDVVGIKVCPVGGAKLCSDALVLHNILDGLKEAGVPPSDIFVVNRYRAETYAAGIDKWVPAGIRMEFGSPAYSDTQLDMEGYDPDHYMEMALIKPGENPNDAHFRRSYVARFVTRRINKFINLPVLKHHQSAGVTIALKNMSHGMVNNVNRSHLTPTSNACGVFIPSVVSLPVIREKAVLHICDAVKASYHGGPGGRPEYMWEHKTMYFSTDPVALDKTGWKAIDARRAQVGMASIALSKPDNASHYLNCQVEHIEFAGMLGLGMFDDAKIDVNRHALT